MGACRGRGLFLVGPSSAGKTSLGRALIELLPEPFLLFETDRMGLQGPTTRPDLETLEFEDIVTRGAALGIRGYLDAGVNMVVERSLWYPRWRGMASSVFSGYDAWVIGLRWERAELERRERQRRDGILSGTAFDQTRDASDWDMPFDLVIDTMAKSAVAAADEVAHWLASRPEPRAIRKMARADNLTSAQESADDPPSGANGSLGRRQAPGWTRRWATAALGPASSSEAGPDRREVTDRSEHLRSRLVDQLGASRAITTARVRQAFLEVPRERFVPDALAVRGLEGVYHDDAIVAKTDGRGAPISSSSQPAIMAMMLEALELTGGQRVLEIGAGTGYNAALLAILVAPGGSVVSVELDAALAHLVRSRLREGRHRARIIAGDGRRGWEKGAPYDRIIATASADSVPRPWFDQLVDGGLVELPLRLNDVTDAQAVVTFRKVNGRLESTVVVWGGFMPLRARAADGYPEPPSMALSSTTGPQRTRLAVMGEFVRHLNASSRRNLAGLLAEQPRRLPLGQRPHRGSVETYLATVNEPNLVICVHERTRATGVLTSDGSSLACLGGGKPLGAPTQIHAWGDESASDRLIGLLSDYRARGSPKLSQLVVTQTYDTTPPLTGGRATGGGSRPGFRWPPPGRGRRSLTAAG